MIEGVNLVFATEKLGKSIFQVKNGIHCFFYVCFCRTKDSEHRAAVISLICDDSLPDNETIFKYVGHLDQPINRYVSTSGYNLLAFYNFTSFINLSTPDSSAAMAELIKTKL